jgi:hypothetical protein
VYEGVTFQEINDTIQKPIYAQKNIQEKLIDIDVYVATK